MALQLLTRRLRLVRTQIPQLLSSHRTFSSDYQHKKPNPLKSSLPSESENKYRELLERCETGSVHVREVRETLKGMIEGGFKVTGKECVLAMVSFSCGGFEVEAKQLLRMLRDKGLAPEEDQVLEVLEEDEGELYGLMMEGLYDKSEEEINAGGMGPPKDQVALTREIRKHVLGYDVGQALKSYKVMLGKGLVPSEYLYDLLVCAVCEYGRPEAVKEASNIVDGMTKRGIKVKERACVSIMSGFLRVGLEGEGKRLLRMVRESGLEPEEGKVKKALESCDVIDIIVRESSLISF